jgi:predicted ferric reductase
MKDKLGGAVWFVLYLSLCLLPLILAAGQRNPRGRSFLVELSIAFGFVGLSMLALQFTLVARFKIAK